MRRAGSQDGGVRRLWTHSDLCAATGARSSGRTEGASGVCIDSRSLQPGDLFVALRGEHGDGHDHVADALARGAAAALVHAPRQSRDPRLLCVDDTQAALMDLGGFARARFAGRLVAVTGSVGKTTTKEMLRTTLSALAPTHAALASHNNHWGVPLTLSRLPPEAGFCVCELGTNHPGEIAPLAALVRADVAILTTVAAVHIGNFGSLEAIAREKGEIVRSLRAGGVAVIPRDGVGMAALAEAARAAGVHVIRVSDSGGGGTRIAELAMDADGSRVTLEIEARSHRIRLAAPGRHMAMDALFCLAAVQALGCNMQAAAEALAGFRPGPGRGAARALLGGAATLLDESYNASSASVRAALARMRLMPARRRVVVLGDMLELGDFAAEEHESLKSCVCDSADIVYCCGAMMTKLYRSLPVAIQGADAPDATELAPLVARDLRPGDLVLVKGSHGSRMREVVAALDGSAGATG